MFRMLVAGAPFSDTHVPRWSLPLILWFPVGCVVSLLRIASCVALILVDSRWLTDTDAAVRFVLRRVLGIEVRWRRRDRLPDKRHCMVSNHQTPADLMVLYRSPARVIQLVAPGIPRRATTCENHRVLLRHATAEQYRALARD